MPESRLATDGGTVPGALDPEEGWEDEVVTHDRISIDPNVMFGKPVIAGTRIPVDLLLEEFAAGLPEEKILSSYPRLTREDFLAAVAFAADCLPGPLGEPTGRIS